MPGSLEGKVALVTGGSRGIGKSIVLAFADEGADVVIASRKLDNCEAVAAEVEAKGRRALAVATHVGKWDDCDRLVDSAYGAFGRCDVLVNNAGMSPLYPSLAEITEEYWDKVTAVNLKGPFRLSAAIGTRMAAGDGGSIINIGTVGSLRPSANEIVYACAKAGLNALTVGLADAFAPKVRANALLPGPVDTDISAGWPPEMRQWAERNTPLGRLGQPGDYAGPAVWLAGEASAFVTGTIIRVDGGMSKQL